MKHLIAGGVLLAMLAVTGCSKPAPTQPTAPTPAPSAPASISTVTAEDLVKKLKAGEKLLVVDVRLDEEYAQGHVPGAHLVPLQTIEQGITKFKKDQEIFLICRSGNRSAQAYAILQSMGYTKLHNVAGGMQAYEKAGGEVAR